jgi:hypothetical protein
VTQVSNNLTAFFLSWKKDLVDDLKHMVGKPPPDKALTPVSVLNHFVKVKMVEKREPTPPPIGNAKLRDRLVESDKGPMFTLPRIGYSKPQPKAERQAMPRLSQEQLRLPVNKFVLTVDGQESVALPSIGLGSRSKLFVPSKSWACPPSPTS